MDVVKTVQNPFAGDLVAKPSGAPALTAQAHTEQQRAIAEVQAAMMIARANPRNPIEAMDRITNACQRPGLAEKALYSYSRGGTDITGPSIRLAEAIAQQWGNIQFGIRELDQRGDMSTVQAFAWDVETNTRREVTFQVPLVRHTKKGSYRLEDPRDIYEMVANQGARRVRACILSVIPGDVVEVAVEQCEETLKAKADTSTDALQRMLGVFAEFGVTKEQIEKRIQRRIEAIQPAQIVSLKKIYVSMRDGMSVASDWFETVTADAQEEGQQKAVSRVDAVKEKLKASKPAATEPEKPKQEEQTAHDPDTGEIAEDENPIPEFGVPEAMELGREHRRQNRPRRAPTDWTDETWTEAYNEGFNAEDAEIQEAAKQKK
jgi:hypothetical protein